MDEFDDLQPTPSAEGDLDLCYRGTVELDPVLWTMGRELLRLNVSFNKLLSIAGELGDLKLLVELNLACNELSALPEEMSKLNQLRVLRCNGNRIEKLPRDIGNCIALEELRASENRLPYLPDSIGQLRKLRVLELMSNRLEMLPYDISEIETLEVVNCDLNPTMDDFIPLKLQRNTAFILWICRTCLDHERLAATIQESNDNLADRFRMMQLQAQKYQHKLEQANESRAQVASDVDKKNNSMGGMLKTAICAVS